MQLEQALAAINRIEKSNLSVEVLVVDNNSTDHTKNIVDSFFSNSRYPGKYLFCKEAGLGNAKNCGLDKSDSQWIIFSDDDCYFAPDYLKAFEMNIRSGDFAYGSGQILLYDKNDDPRIANLRIERKILIQPYIAFLRIRPVTAVLAKT